jgi:prepilin-type N-terminal cleavage/methylation domain-containing protein
MRRIKGFTLIELMIVVAIIAIIAAIAVPNLLSARLNANETSAISTLRNISSSQAQFQASSRADADVDGTGEFGFFRELSGGGGVRADNSGSEGAPLNPPVLSGAFRTMNTATATVSRSGYIFKLFLPAITGAAVEETPTGNSFALDLDADLAETTWCGYAWPANYGNSGNRTFFVNQTGDITASDNGSYTGSAAIDTGLAHAAFQTSSVGDMTGLVAVGTRGGDNNLWRQVN